MNELSPTPPTPQTTNSSKVVTLLLAIILVLVSGVILLGYQVFSQQNLPVGQSITQPTPTLVLDSAHLEQGTINDSATPSSELQTMPSEWATTKFGGLFSYQYPSGWHVAELWDMGTDRSVMIAMDPAPISSAPRGGPIATIEISVINGKPNPNETLEQKKAEIDMDYFTNITSETVTMSHGEVYHFKGESTADMGFGVVVEKYIFSIKESQTDPINQQVIIANSFPKSDADSERLRYIVENIKEIKY